MKLRQFSENVIGHPSALISLGIAFLLAVLSTGSPVFAGKLQKLHRQAVGPGMTYFEIQGLQARVVEIDLRNEMVDFDIGLPPLNLAGLETVQSMAKRSSRPGHWVVAGIGSIFQADPIAPAGLVIRKGCLLRSAANFDSFVWTFDSKPLIASVINEITVSTSDGGLLALDDMNRGPFAGLSSFLTPQARRWVTIPQESYGLLLEPQYWDLEPNDSLEAMIAGFADPLASMNIKEDQFGLVVSKNDFDAMDRTLLIGDWLNLKLGTVCPSEGRGEFRPWTALEGGPRLLSEGQIVVLANHEYFLSDYMDNPRSRWTSIGFDKKTKTAWVVETPGTDPGGLPLSLRNIGRLFKTLGAQEALVLSAGDPSTFYVRHDDLREKEKSTKDKPSRLVACSLFLISRAPLGPPRNCQIVPQYFELLPKQTIDLSLVFFDEYQNRIDEMPEYVNWSILKGEAEIDQEGRLTAGRRESQITVKASVGGAVKSSILAIATLAYGTVVQPMDLRIQPEDIRLGLGDRCKLSAQYQREAGKWRPVPRSLLEWELRGDAGTLTEEGLFFALKEGRATARFHLGRQSVETEIVVGEKKYQLLEGFAEINDWWITTSGPMHSAACRIEKATQSVVSGSACLKLSYDFRTTSDNSAIQLNTRQSIASVPEKILLKVRADGSGNLLGMRIVDVDGQRFLFDAPIRLDWNLHWKEIEFPLSGFSAKPPASSAIDPPVFIEKLILFPAPASTRDFGTILLDDLGAIFPPE